MIVEKLLSLVLKKPSQKAAAVLDKAADEALPAEANLLERLKAHPGERRRIALDCFRDLVDALARGDDPKVSAATVHQLLEAAGKTPEDLEAEVSLLQEIAELQRRSQGQEAASAAYDRAREDLRAAEEAFREIEAAHKERIRQLEARENNARGRFREISKAGYDARNKVRGLEERRAREDEELAALGKKPETERWPIIERR